MSDLLRMVDSLAANEYLVLLGPAIGLTSLLYAIYLHRKRKKEALIKSLACQIFSTNIVRDRQAFFPELTITYHGQTLDRITSSNCVLKNTGTEVLRAHDIAQKDPLLVAPRDDEITILDCQLVEASNPASNVAVTKVQTGYLLTFDFLEPDDKARFQILHTGGDSGSLKLSGTLIGAKRPLKISSELSALETHLRNPVNRFLLRFPRTSFVVLMACPLGLLLYLLYYTWGTWWLNALLAIPTFFFATWVFALLSATRRGLSASELRDRVRGQLEQNILESMSRAATRKRAREAKKETDG